MSATAPTAADLSRLYRPVLLPDAASFEDVLEYVEERNLSTEPITHERPKPAATIGENEVSFFCSYRVAVGGLSTAMRASRTFDVRPTQAALDAVAGRIVTPDDTLSWRIVEHDNGRALVILEHGYILGSHWLAYIDARTIPAPDPCLVCGEYGDHVEGCAVVNEPLSSNACAVCGLPIEADETADYGWLHSGDYDGEAPGAHAATLG